MENAFSDLAGFSIEKTRLSQKCDMTQKIALGNIYEKYKLNEYKNSVHVSFIPETSYEKKAMIRSVYYV